MRVGAFISYKYGNVVKFDYIDAIGLHATFLEIILTNGDSICDEQIIKIYEDDEPIFL